MRARARPRSPLMDPSYCWLCTRAWWVGVCLAANSFVRLKCAPGYLLVWWHLLIPRGVAPCAQTCVVLLTVWVCEARAMSSVLAVAAAVVAMAAGARGGTFESAAGTRGGGGPGDIVASRTSAGGAGRGRRRECPRSVVRGVA